MEINPEDHLKIIWKPLAAHDLLWNLVLKTLLPLSLILLNTHWQGEPQFMKIIWKISQKIVMLAKELAFINQLVQETFISSYIYACPNL